MKLFAIELSTSHGSIALIENGKIISEKSWIENFKNRQQLFNQLSELCSDWDTIDHFIVGRGPGAFSGLRISFTVANALAAPLKKPIYALNSGAALAAQIGAPRTAIVGDARRNKVWAGVFNGTTLEKEFQLMEYQELSGFIPEGVLTISPDHDRLEALLENFQTLENPTPVFPTAGKLGQLAFQCLEKSIPSEPLEPLYMHPAVFVKPRFPAQ